jgi:hypothetical protein
VKRLTLFLITVFFVEISAAGIKYVAVVESDIDEASGASEKISRADVRLVTAELRREAVKNLPPKRYVIMTAETVMAQGGAVLEECAEENCVITLGSKIGADYIVRGTVSKLESLFTLQVEMYETDNGNLVASCDPVRSESIRELVEKAAVVCAEMFKTWLASQESESEPQKAAKSGRKKTYIGVNYTLVNSPPIKSLILPPSVRCERINADAGTLWSSGTFFGFNTGFGFGKEEESTWGIGVDMNVGYAFHLPSGFTLSPGGSIGFWMQESKTEDLVDKIIYDIDDGYSEYNGYIEYKETNTMYFFGPFIKARWYFIEVSYKGIIGKVGTKIVSDFYGIKEPMPSGDSRWYWINQVNVGLYIEY